MARTEQHLRSGFADVDELLDGLLLGDNVVWVLEGRDGPHAVELLEQGMLAEGLRRKQRCVYVTARTDPARVGPRFGPGVAILDARPRSRHASPAALEAAVIEAARGTPPGCVVFDGLDHLARRWGASRAVAFFARVCPLLFDIGALAYWRAPKAELGRSFLEQVTQVTQCVLELADGQLRVVKAEGRAASIQGKLLRLRVADGGIHLEDERSSGRVGRGLERLRRERNLSQSDLARLLKVTPSAISQAEAGRRGLSLDTLLVLSDRLGVGLDDFLASTPGSGYVLARHPRGTAPGVSALLDDPQAGLRTYLVRLGPDESGSPDFAHKGAEMVLVASGLIQVTIGPDTPVMRAGDAVLATRTAITGWHNLLTEPAVLFLVLRD